jgi:hypothetical protein
MELISPLLRVDFREFCVNNFILRQINDIFTMAGIKAGRLSPNQVISGQRRTLVEEHYSTINWHRQDDANKFLKVLGYALAQSFSTDDAREKLKSLYEREGLAVDGIQVSFKRDKPTTNKYSPISVSILAKLKDQFLMLDKLDPHHRGFEFEKFLKDLFECHQLAPRSSFRLIGEQIDGSFELSSDVYLLEAKWHAKQTAQVDLLAFREKVESKSAWSRGLFVSMSGFTDDGLTAFARGRATNIIGMTGQDLFFILSGDISLADALSKKARKAAETGEFYVPVFDLVRS